MSQTKWHAIKNKYKDDRFNQVHSILVGFNVYAEYAYLSAGEGLLKVVISDGIKADCLKKIFDELTLEEMGSSNMGLELIFRVVH